MYREFCEFSHSKENEARLTLTCISGPPAIDKTNIKDMLRRTNMLISPTYSTQLLMWPKNSVSCDEETCPRLLVSASKISEKRKVWLAISYLEQFQSINAKHRVYWLCLDRMESKSSSIKRSILLMALKHDWKLESPLPTFQASFGRVGAAVCHDMDFSMSVHKLAGSDLILNPAYSWGSVGNMHAEMAKYRAVELGTHVFRCASTGMSASYAPSGMLMMQVPMSADNSNASVSTTVYHHWTPQSMYGDYWAIFLSPIALSLA